jgi:hypothetical protein
MVYAEMRKLVLTFLLVLMPLQFAQAALCPYTCDMEASTQQSDGPESAVANEETDKSTQTAPHRCAFCDLSHAKFIPNEMLSLTAANTAAACFQPDTFIYRSPIPTGLDRPNWSHFA